MLARAFLLERWRAAAPLRAGAMEHDELRLGHHALSSLPA
jgi:hypothetical protein